MSDLNGFSTKEIVIEVMKEVKALSNMLQRIDREGSIGTKRELADHEQRIRDHTTRIVRVEDTVEGRQGILDQFKAMQDDIENLKALKWQILGAVGVMIFLLTTLATVSWHVWG